MWGDHEINSDTTMGNYVTDGGHRAVKNLKDVLTAWKYHQTSAINTILVNQVARVGNMLEAMEVYLLATTIRTRGGNLAPYQRQNLQTKWRAFMQQAATKARSKADTYITKWLEMLQNDYTSAV